jgi:hypothetical protein
VVFSTTLQSSRHGVAVPVDDDHVLYSLASPERLSGNLLTSLVFSPSYLSGRRLSGQCLALNRRCY